MSSTVADGVVIVVGAGTTKREQLSRSIASLSAVKTNLLGIVLNKVARKGPDAYTYYHDGYSSVPTSRSTSNGHKAKAKVSARS